MAFWRSIRVVVAWILAASVAAIITEVFLSASGQSQSPGAVKQAVTLKPRYVDGKLYLPVADATRQYVSESNRLVLAYGWIWPLHPLRPSNDGAPVYYETGFGTQSADRYWFCSWAASSISQPNATSRQKGINKLEEIRQLYYYKHSLVQRSKVLLLRELTDAKRGNLTALRTDVRLNCPKP